MVRVSFRFTWTVGEIIALIIVDHAGTGYGFDLSSGGVPEHERRERISAGTRRRGRLRECIIEIEDAAPDAVSILAQVKFFCWTCPPTLSV